MLYLESTALVTALTMAATWPTVSSPVSGGSKESALGRDSDGEEGERGSDGVEGGRGSDGCGGREGGRGAVMG